MIVNKYVDQVKTWFYENADGKTTKWWLGAISFTESSFFPIPPDPFLMAVLMVKSEKWLCYSLFVAILSTIGAAFGYLIGFAFFEIIGVALVDFYDLHDELITITALFQDNLFWTMFTAAFTPIPFKLFTISAGLFEVNFFIFMLASFIGRVIRFLAVGYIMKLFGEKIGVIVFRYFNVGTLVVAILIVGYIVIKIFSVV